MGVQVESQDLLRWNRSVPRYTSYPTAPQFYSLGLTDATSALKRFDESVRPLSLYLHIPFCSSMCLFCGCSVILNRRPEKQASYVDLICKEILLAAKEFTSKRKVTQLHFGGGTPTMLTEAEFDQILGVLHSVFSIDADAEVSIEIDPRTVYSDEGKKLRYLKKAGFNRVSFGVQDLDPVVQEAVRRRQSEEMTIKTFEMAREIGFSGINIDLIYGLPYQTTERFQRTAHRISEMRPDRIAFFSYAKVPWLKEHQKAMPEEAEPSIEEKFQIYVDARKIFLEAGYEAIGMDHFSLSEDSLTKAFHQKDLWRNFQGYSLKLADDLLGFGVTSIGFMDSAFLQNVKTIEEYRREIEADRLPVLRGYVLDEEDQLRRWVIQRIMCHFELDKREFERIFSRSFDEHFALERAALEALKEEGMLEESADKLLPTELGCLFIRLIASVFDAYLKSEDRFSKSI